MRPLEILALLVVALAGIKILLIFFNPKAWMPVVKAIYSRPILTSIFALLAAGFILKYLLVELSIVQIFAAMSLTMALMLIGAAAFGNEIIALAEKLLKDKAVLKRAWLSIIVWIALIIWAIYELFK